MKRYQPFYESVKLQEKWIKEFQQLSKHDQFKLRQSLTKYKVDIENTDFKVMNPLMLGSSDREWKDPSIKMLFLAQTRDYKTQKPGQLELFCIYSNGQMIDEYKYSISGGEVFYNKQGNEVLPSNAGKTTVSYRQGRPITRPANSIDLKYLPRKEIIRLSKYVVIMYPATVKSSADIQRQRQAARDGSAERTKLYLNPADGEYYTSPNFNSWDKASKYVDKSGFKSRAGEWQNKLSAYRKDKILSQGDEVIINEGIKVYQELLSKISLAPGIKKVPANMDDITSAIRRFGETLASYFSAIDDMKARSGSEYYAEKAKRLLLDLKEYTARMNKLNTQS